MSCSSPASRRMTSFTNSTRAARVGAEPRSAHQAVKVSGSSATPNHHDAGAARLGLIVLRGNEPSVVARREAAASSMMARIRG